MNWLKTVLFFMWLILNRDQMEISRPTESHIEFHTSNLVISGKNNTSLMQNKQMAEILHIYDR